MASAAQIIANRENAQKSTGPTTEQGKAISAQNAFKHGLTARKLVIPDEDREEYNQMHRDLWADARPVGALAGEVFHQLINAAWNLRRIERMQTEALCSGDDPFGDNAKQDRLRLLLRYHAHFNRVFNQTMKTLRELQSHQVSLAFGFPAHALDDIPSYIDIGDLHKARINAPRAFTRKDLSATIPPPAG